jgi:hypothetical protein
MYERLAKFDINSLACYTAPDSSILIAACSGIFGEGQLQMWKIPSSLCSAAVGYTGVDAAPNPALTTPHNMPKGDVLTETQGKDVTQKMNMRSEMEKLEGQDATNRLERETAEQTKG